MNNRVQKRTMNDLLKTIGSGNNSSEVGTPNCVFSPLEIPQQPLSNGYQRQIIPLHQPNTSPGSISNHDYNGFGSTQMRNQMNPAFSGFDGQLPGPNPFQVEQVSSRGQDFNNHPLSQPSDYSDGSGLLFVSTSDLPRPGDVEKVDSNESFSWLADDPAPTTTSMNVPVTTSTNFPSAAHQPSYAPPPPHKVSQAVDPVMAAAMVSGIDQNVAEQGPTVSFVRQPGDVQFRYRKELLKGTVSPIWADGAPKQYPSVEISNVPLGQTYNLELLLMNENLVTSVHKFYQTKPLNATKNTFTYTVTHDQTIDLENIGVLRATSEKRGDNDLHNSVVLGVRLVHPHGGWEVDKCHSKEILDLKKTMLRINHINPQKGFNSNRVEVTILCSKISDDTEVIFEHGAESLKAEVVLRHHGCALVVRPPTFPRQRENFQAKVRLHCPKRNRFSDPKFFEYHVDPLDNIDTVALANFHHHRDRSPLRTDYSRLVLDGVTSDLEQLTLDSRDTIAKCDQLVAALNVKMADLEKIRDVAAGREAWSEEVKELLSKAPYILHVQDGEGFTPPMRALISGEARVFEHLLSSVTDTEQKRLLSSRTCGGATLLHLLAIPQQFQSPRTLLQMMLDLGADPLKTDENGQTVMHWLVRKNRVSLLKTIIELIDQFFRQRDDSRDDSKAALRQLLDRLDSNGQAAIHCAVLNSAIGAIDVLVTAGAALDLRCPNSGLTALHWAIIENNELAVKTLIDRGAYVHIETNWGATALDVARQSRETQESILQALHKAGASRGSNRSSEEED